MIELSVSSTIFGVPASHRHCDFNNFRWPSDGIKRSILFYLERLLAGERPNLLITGTPGNGKTHLSVALYRWGVLHLGGTMKCALVHVPVFLHEVKKGFDREIGDVRIGDPFADVEDAKELVVLDDILGRNPTPWEMDHILFRLVNTSYTNGASLVTTTNYSINQLGEWMKPHELSRLLQNATHLVFTGADQRVG